MQASRRKPAASSAGGPLGPPQARPTSSTAIKKCRQIAKQTPTTRTTVRRLISSRPVQNKQTKQTCQRILLVAFCCCCLALALTFAFALALADTETGAELADANPFEPTRAPAALDDLQPADDSSRPRSALISAQKPAFRRINELEKFLDEMNHNEVRAVASGKPLDDLFEPKLAQPATNQAQVDAHNQNQNQNQPAQVEASNSERRVYSECALILQRTYVKSDIQHHEHPKHLPFGKTEEACISYKHIDRAVEQAKHKLKFRDSARADGVAQSLEPPHELVAAIGEVNMATTQILADQFDLSNDELLNGLPLIDMSKTKFWPMCPLLVKQRELRCHLDRFRSFTGHCNNLKHPTWGAAMTPFARYLPPMHPDGIWAPRRSLVSELTFQLDTAGGGASLPPPHFDAPGAQQVAPGELPPARLVSALVHRDVELASHDLSILFMSWGQLLDHDMTRAAQPPSSVKCCDREPGRRHKLCLPIGVPDGDPLYSRAGVKCLEFRRSLAGLRPNCVLGPRVHQNAITAPIDANFVYGSSRRQADSLRQFQGGRLLDRDWFQAERLKPLLPAQEAESDDDCLARPAGLFCFRAGDVRANEQTHLTVLHTLYMREHNRLAGRLAELNPHWPDERLYQEARHLVAAGVQHVLLNEYLPLLLGAKMVALYNLTSASDDDGGHYWHGYDPSVTTSVSNSFAAAAFRQGHTFIQSTVERWTLRNHEFVGAEKLRHLFKQPFLIYQPGVLDELVGGLVNQPAQSYDPFVSAEVAGHLFQLPAAQVGHDLASINLQRGREQGLPGYNLFREWCGLPRAQSFDDLAPYLTNSTAHLYSRLYKHVDDIDLWSGGISERKLPGAAIGPTFACIIARQFSNTRRGDRFWFENPGLPSSFTAGQLAQVRKVSLAKILCANADDMPTVQRWALRTAHPVLNQRLACHDLPEPDLRHWQEDRR